MIKTHSLIITYIVTEQLLKEYKENSCPIFYSRFNVLGWKQSSRTTFNKNIQSCVRTAFPTQYKQVKQIYISTYVILENIENINSY